MAQLIGTTAGKVWQFLEKNGPASATKISKALEENTSATHQALGWLAREGKLDVDDSKKSQRYMIHN
jgi:DNA-binding IclR family transcriptional regulator